MRDCIQCGAKHHHVCAIKVGQEEMSTKCAKCFKGDQSNNDSDESDSEKKVMKEQIRCSKLNC